MKMIFGLLILFAQLTYADVPSACSKRLEMIKKCQLFVDKAREKYCAGCSKENATCKSVCSGEKMLDYWATSVDCIDLEWEKHNPNPCDAPLPEIK